MNCFVHNFRVRKLYLILKLSFFCAVEILRLAFVVKMRRLIVSLVIFCDAIGLTYLMHKLAIILFTDIPVPSFAFKSAFTTPEVLMIVAITGTVGMLTIPEMIEGQYEFSTYVTLKRDFAVYSDGFNMAIQQNGTPDNWNLGGSGDATGLANINTIISQNFKVTQNCGTGSGCFPESTYKNLNGTDNQITLDKDNTYTKMRLADGTSIAIKQWNSNCNGNWGDTLPLQSVCGIVGIDINGDKAPNTYGQDFFGFAFTKYGLVPLGTAMQGKEYSFTESCNKRNNAISTYENGLSCTAWVIYKGNMDYKRNNNLSWDNNNDDDDDDESNGNCGNGVGRGGHDGSGLGNGVGNTCKGNGNH